MPVSDTPSTVLIVEDEILVRMHGTDILEEAGYVVIEAADADEALEILSRLDGVHLLFSDIDMPGSINGLDLAQLVHERWPHIRLLLTSGHHRLDDNHVPADGRFVGKPWQHEALVGKVRELLAA
jgi:DNA-binding NtrC family response regulator